MSSKEIIAGLAKDAAKRARLTIKILSSQSRLCGEMISSSAWVGPNCWIEVSMKERIL